MANSERTVHARNMFVISLENEHIRDLTMNSSIFRHESPVFFCGLTVTLVLLLFGGISADAQCVQQTAKLLADDGAGDDQFGWSRRNRRDHRHRWGML